MLPAQPNQLIGREEELSAVVRLMRSADARMVTITGSPGAGKTRLALAAAALLTDIATDGLWFVELAPIHDPRQVITAIGRATGVREHRGELAKTRVERHIGQRNALLLLDNFEQVLEGATDLAVLLAACRNLRILVTSRAPLHLRWERVFSVPPLALPAPSALPPPAELAQIPAVALFIERAQAVDPTFRLTPANSAQIAEICVRLDGLPLAIELAAARSDVYTPAEVLARLRRRFDVLTAGPGDLPARQQSLEATFDWSYELLSTSDQAVFRALGVFVGGFTPDAALAVAGSDDASRLVQHSLVRRAADDENRFRMLETVRAYALERLERCGERQSASEKHARFMLDLAERAAPELVGARQAFWLTHLERDHDNLSAALRWTIEAGAVELSLRLASALWRFWWLHGDLSEGMNFVDAVLFASRNVPSSLQPARSAVLNGAGVLAHIRGEYERAMSLITESLDVARELGMKMAMAAALHNLGALARERGDWPRARAVYEESLSIEREIGNTWGIATSLINLGALAEDQGDIASATALLEESLALLRGLGDTRGIASALHNLAAVARSAGDWQRAAELNEESLALWRKLGDAWGTASALTELAKVIERAGDWRRSARLYDESLKLFGSLGIRQATAGCLEGFAAVLCDADRAADAVRMLGAADALREETGAQLPSRDRDDLARTVARGRAATSATVYRRAWQLGRSLSADEAAAQALRLMAELRTLQPEAKSTVSRLSEREREVVELVARGLTNRQIAERLVISERTADRHVSNILRKLGLSTRAQVAAWAVEMGTTNTPFHP